RDLVSHEVRLQGRAAMRETYGRLFAVGTVHAELVGRLVVGDVAVDEERVTGHPSGAVVRALAHYAVADGLIRQVWFSTEVDGEP
ncbi:MAG: nuclear transport factor 2 family protein, partial [Myxococcota bacterium]